MAQVYFRFSISLQFDDNIYKGESWTHVKEIPNTKLLVSLYHNCYKSTNMEIFDISKKDQPKKIYSLGEVSGSKIYYIFVY